MTPLALFINPVGRLRSGWRYTFYVCAFLATYFFVAPLVGDRFRLTLLAVATLLGWVCGRLFEDLPSRALGWGLHRGWLRDLLLGSALGVLSLALAAGIGWVAGGLRFEFAGWGVMSLRHIASAAIVFTLAAAAEEAVCRGYQLQTLMRSWPFWLAVLPSSAFFASGHLLNPNVSVLGVLNTFLAGIWLAVGYHRTRSLWLPLGLHWAWNWATASLLGLPVSGVVRHSGNSAWIATDVGPAWLTGGAYGVEGGVACTVALILSTLFIWKTPVLTADAELKAFTDAEVPAREKSGDVQTV
ncbi:MAG: lysostaphin resistance A-like protein [Pyrinomonadaceae bacterium]